MKICFTTALFGDPKTLDTPVKFERNPNYDYFLFTDIDEEHFDTSWDIINIKDNPNISNLTSNVRKSRYPKFMSWELLESMEKNYDVVFYCDVVYSPNLEYNWQVGSKILFQTSDQFKFLQSFHHDGSRSIYSELQHIIKNNRDSKKSIENLLVFLKELDPNVNIHTRNFVENTTFGYAMKNELVKNFTKEFWKIYSKNNISFRDQPLWNFLLLKNNLNSIICKHISKKDNKFRYNYDGCMFQLTGQKGSMRENYKKGEI